MTRGRCGDCGSPPCGVAEQRQHFVADDADDLLVRRQALEDLLIDGAIADAIDERLDDLEVDVRLEQRHADLAEGGLDGRLRKPGFAAKRAKNLLQTVAERVKHPKSVLNDSGANPYRNRAWRRLTTGWVRRARRGYRRKRST